MCNLPKESRLSIDPESFNGFETVSCDSRVGDGDGDGNGVFDSSNTVCGPCESC